jgi:aminopeptidase N
MYDNMNDKFTTETITTFDKDYSVLSNGALKSVKANADGTKTWHYAMGHPHAGYLLMLAIDKYAIKKTKTKTGVPVAFYYYPESPEKVEPTSMYTEKMIEFLEEETGIPYPWESYSQVMVQDFMYGAMENTTATIFGDFFNVDSRGFLDRNYIGVNCHELTHQWFGDLITARGGGDTWLQESYATYYAKIFFGTIEGDDRVKMMQRQEMNAALRASETDNNPIRFSGAGTARVYQKEVLLFKCCAMF